MSIAVKRQFQVSPVRIAWVRGRHAARVAGMRAGRCLTVSRNWAETLGEGALPAIGLDRSEIRSALARMDEVRARGKSDWLT